MQGEKEKLEKTGHVRVKGLTAANCLPSEEGRSFRNEM